MTIIALDTETTTTNKGDPFDIRNRFVVGGYGTSTSCNLFTADNTKNLSTTLETTKLLILFNGKFDLHWLRRIGITIPIRLPIWDCQLAEFILANQRKPYPALEEACSRYGIGHKIDVIKNEYWDKGIDTDQIPSEILHDYLTQDVSLTYQLYLKQKELFNLPEHHSKRKVFILGCFDLLALEEMEWNGYKFDVEAALSKAATLAKECNEIDTELAMFYPDIPINYSSPDNISAVLYGGVVRETIKLPMGTYKTGKRAGEIKYQNVEQQYTLPRLVEPLKGSELAKEGFYSTNEDVLNSLPTKGTAKKLIALLLKRRGLEKLRATYYEGVPKLIREHCWQQQLVHGNLNQCVTNTGRLSATKPNQQNMSGEVKKLCVSRYG